jgi:TRAP-type C4-dicarboxylate transport system substrate-binding protein
MKESAMTRIWILGAIIAISATVSGCGEDSDKAGGEESSEAVVLTLANPDNNTSELDDYAREVESQSGGALQIEFENDWRTGDADNELGAIEDVRAGKVDLASVGAGSLDLVPVDSLQPLVAPFAIDSYALERKVLESPLAAELLAGVEDAGVVPITLLPGGLRKPLGISRPLVEASDYRGATIGIHSSELSARTFEALGAKTVGYHSSDDVSSFDGIETEPIPIAFTDADLRGQTLAANVSLWPRILTIVMNRDAYAALSDDQREALTAAGAAALVPSIEQIQNREEEAVGVLCNRGELELRSASPAELESLHAATAPVTRALEHDPVSRDAMRQIAAMRAEVEPEPAATCEVEDTVAASGPTPVDGLWRMETTREDAATLMPNADLVPENWGEFTYAFEAGRFAFTTESEGDVCIWAYGSYTVDGETVEWRIEDGGGETPNDAANSPGETFTYGWSRYRDQLTLTPLEGAISPEPFRVKPWRLLEGEPTVDALSDRCPPPADALEP